MKIIKRNGDFDVFDPEKITAAIHKAFHSVDMVLKEEEQNRLLTAIQTCLEEKTGHGTIGVEDIQNVVERILAESGYLDVAKAYMIYRIQHQNIREVASDVINYADLMNGYLDRLDRRVKESSTVQYTLGGLILSNSGAVTANYWLNHIYDREIADAHKDCIIHLHDLSMLSGYCAVRSLRQLIKEGIKGVSGRISSAPAAHLSTLCNQMVNFIGIMQNEWAGAQAFTSFDTYLAPFVKADRLSYQQVKQGIQSFVFGVNTPNRWEARVPSQTSRWIGWYRTI